MLFTVWEVCMGEIFAEVLGNIARGHETNAKYFGEE